MKRKIAIATTTAAALLGTGALSAAAIADDGDRQRPASSVQAADRGDKDDRGERDDTDEHDAVPTGLKITAAVAAEKAADRGTVTSVDFDDDSDRTWEVEVVGKNKKETELTVDASTGKVTQTPADKDDDKDDTDDHDDD